MIRSNFHTHTCYDDGKDTPRDMIEAALDLGFTALGFSGHGFTPFDTSYAMSKENTAKYRSEVFALKEEYKDKIAIFCGVEQDYYTGKPDENYDYIIGSVHYVENNGVYYAMDNSVEEMQRAITAYGDDVNALAEDYFKNTADVVNAMGADIIGHFDIVSKYSKVLGYGESERFLNAAEQAVKTLVAYGKPFEINTGAMARGTRNIPYPSPAILKKIYQHGGKIIFSSDCHDKQNLAYGFDTAKALVLSCGFSEHMVLTESGMKPEKM